MEWFESLDQSKVACSLAVATGLLLEAPAVITLNGHLLDQDYEKPVSFGLRIQYSVRMYHVKKNDEKRKKMESIVVGCLLVNKNINSRLNWWGLGNIRVVGELQPVKLTC